MNEKNIFKVITKNMNSSFLLQMIFIVTLTVYCECQILRDSLTKFVDLIGKAGAFSHHDASLQVSNSILKETPKTLLVRL